jgi:hypothetical protein
VIRREAHISTPVAPPNALARKTSPAWRRRLGVVTDRDTWRQGTVSCARHCEPWYRPDSLGILGEEGGLRHIYSVHIAWTNVPGDVFHGCSHGTCSLEIIADVGSQHSMPFSFLLLHHHHHAFTRRCNCILTLVNRLLSFRASACSQTSFDRLSHSFAHFAHFAHVGSQDSIDGERTPRRGPLPRFCPCSFFSLPPCSYLTVPPMRNPFAIIPRIFCDRHAPPKNTPPITPYAVDDRIKTEDETSVSHSISFRSPHSPALFAGGFLLVLFVPVRWIVV